LRKHHGLDIQTQVLNMCFGGSAMMVPKPGNALRRESRERLLDAAGEVFARYGHHAGATKEICRRSGTKAAAVDYHSGDKQKPAEDAVRYVHRYAIENYPPGIEAMISFRGDGGMDYESIC
jgi:AcrR family transcriptional regulator